MRVFTNGRVTIPKAIREKLSITPGCDVDFRLEKGRYYLHNAASESGPSSAKKRRSPSSREKPKAQ